LVSSKEENNASPISSDGEFAQVKISTYVSLHNHTNFSILDSLIKPIDLFKRSKELGMTACGVTDHGTLSGLWDSLKASRETGVKLIPGCEFYFIDDVNNKEQQIRHIILLSKDEVGYRNLLLTLADGFNNSLIATRKVYPLIDWNILEKYSEGLICTTACGNGILSQLINKKEFDEARKQAQRLKNIYGDNLAVELQAHGLKRISNSHSSEIDQRFTNIQLRKIAEELDIRCIVATDAHYIRPEQYKSHDVLLAMSASQPIDSGSRLKYNVNDFYIKSEEEIYTKLKRLMGNDEEFVKKCIDNTKYFADQCLQPDWIETKYSNPTGKELPDFPVKDQEDYGEFLKWAENYNDKDGKQEDALYYRYKCFLELDKRIENGKLDKDNKQLYLDRLFEEFDVIEARGFSSYMLIVADILDWARKNDISIGPGRGSVGGSFSAYLMNIHLANPFKYDFIFARFLNKFKEAFPDVDNDVASSGRERLLEYIKNKYGENNIAHVSNMATMTVKPFVKGLSRTFMFGGDRKTAVKIGMDISDSIPSEFHKVKSALEGAPLFAEYAKTYPQITEYADDIGNQLSNWATHAAGVVISKRELRGLVPIRRDKDNVVALEYEKERAESNGLVKIDFLGLGALDLISETHRLIAKTGKELLPFDYESYDEETYNLISSGNTFCVFQLGTSGGTIDLCKKIKPKNIEDIAIINALARPSAKTIREDFVATRNGIKPVNIKYPILKRAFESTLGFGLYEECLMYLAMDCAQWDLHEADKLRKLTKEKNKNPEKAKKWRKEFIESSVTNGVDSKIAKDIWDNTISGFSGYGFNKSHAVLYSFVSYHTAWLKAHYPLEFLIANLKSEVKSNAKISADNIAKIKDEIRKLNVKILPPDINNSEETYTIVDDTTVITGFDALKHIGKNSIPEIIAKRPFSSFEDFVTRLDAHAVNAKSIQALAAAGCLDGFELTRKQIYLYSSDYKKKLLAYLKRKKKTEKFEYPWPEIGEFTISEKFALEYLYLGEGLSGNKIEVYDGFFNHSADENDFIDFPKRHPPPSDTLTEKERKKYTHEVTCVQCEIKSFFEFKVKKEGKLQGQTMCRVLIEDTKGNKCNMVVFPDQLVELKDFCLNRSGGKYPLQPGIGLWINGNLSWYEGEISIIFEQVLKFAPPPQVPLDLEHKKVAMKRASKKDEVEVVIEEKDSNLFLEEIEEELIQMGQADLDDDEDDDD